jgi:hypothetical protein
MPPLQPQGPQSETSVEYQILAELLNLRQELREFRTVLMGDGKSETKHGRVPVLEDKVDDHEKRITDLERTRVRWGAFGVAAGVVIAGAQWLFGFLFGHR